MGFFSRIAGLTAFSVAAGAAANGVQSAHASASGSTTTVPRHDDSVAFNSEYHKYKLAEVFNCAEDVAVFRFLLRRPETPFNLPACSTLQCFQKNSFASNAENIQRNYTPITPNGEKGYFDLLVKKQPHGRMTEHMFSMKPGESLEFRVRAYKLKYKPNYWSHMGLICGGTGITPMLQVIREMVADPTDNTKMSLCFGNQTEDKILLRGLLDELEEKSNGRLKNHFIIDRVDETNKDTWKGSVGYMDESWLYKRLPPASDNNGKVLICGPDNMMINIAGMGRMTLATMSSGVAMQGTGTQQSQSVGGVLGRLGYIGDQVYRF